MPASDGRDVNEVLAKAREILAAARQGLDDLFSDDENRRIFGIHNVAVFGRSVTFVLQNLRSATESFDAWYEPIKEAMQADPLLRYFVELRNEILKEGGPVAHAGTFVEYFNIEDLRPVMAQAPPGAGSFSIADDGRTGWWEIKLPDGSIEKYYVPLPSTIKMRSTLHFPDPPQEHLGEPLVDTSLQNLGRLYVDYLTSLVEDAKAQFADGQD
jgi:hypothetical protein